MSPGLDGPFATWLGWLMPHGAPLTLVAGLTADIASAQRELARIGIDRPAAAATGTPAGPRRRLRSATLAELAAARPDVILDVRHNAEFRAGHLTEAVHVPLPDLAGRIGGLPEAEIWVHCAAGYRAAVAASLLLRAGHRVVHVDDNWVNARDLCRGSGCCGGRVAA